MTAMSFVCEIEVAGQTDEGRCSCCHDNRRSSGKSGKTSASPGPANDLAAKSGGGIRSSKQKRL